MSRHKRRDPSERCEFSDLWPEECSHCTGAKDEDTRPVLGVIVVAELEGTCQAPDCDDRKIVPGDHIGFMGEVTVAGKKVKQWAHYGCGR